MDSLYGTMKIYMGFYQFYWYDYVDFVIIFVNIYYFPITCADGTKIKIGHVKISSEVASKILITAISTKVVKM